MSQTELETIQPLMTGLMIAFVAGSILFILTAEFVRRRNGGSDGERKDRKAQDRKS